MSAKSKAQRNSILIAAAIAVALTAWVLSGVVGGTPENPAPARAGVESIPAVPVTVRHSRAREIVQTIDASAHTEPDRYIEIKAETEGRIVAIGAERGLVVQQGQLLVEIDQRDRQARLAETDALILQRELEYEAGQRLRDEEFISPAELAARVAALEAARAARQRIALEIDHTTIRAPFAAVVYDRLVEIGDYVGIGDPIAQLIDADPLIVVADINERDIGAVRMGSTGMARLVDGTELEGRIRYLAPAADESTRSFRIELAVPNPDYALRVGTSAQVELATGTILAHELSPGLLWLADDGTTGVNIVDSSNRVRFKPVEIADSTSEFMYVTGLPDEARIITIGQGFVVDGQAVVPQTDERAH